MPTYVKPKIFPYYTLLAGVKRPDLHTRTTEVCDILLIKESRESLHRMVAMGQSLSLPEDAPVNRIRCAGQYACPGFVDLHTHIREPGAMYKESIRTVTAAAALGGYRTLLSIPYPPAAGNSATVDYIRSNAAVNGSVDIQNAVYLTVNNAGQVLTDVEDAIAHGAIAFYEEGRTPLPLLCRGMEAIARSGSLLIVQPSIAGLPYPTAQSVAVATVLSLAASTGCRLHLTALSTAAAVEAVRAAKARGLAVTCDTAPQYFTLTKTDLFYYGNLAKVNPPLGSSADREAIIVGLADGTIDCIACDHTPEFPADKKQSAQDAPAGMIGLQTAFGLGMRELVATGRLDFYRLMELLAVRPGEILGLPPAFVPGESANFILLDLSRSYTLTERDLKTPAAACPWIGQSFQGAVTHNYAHTKEV